MAYYTEATPLVISGSTDHGTIGTAKLASIDNDIIIYVDLGSHSPVIAKEVHPNGCMCCLPVLCVKDTILGGLGSVKNHFVRYSKFYTVIALFLMFIGLSLLFGELYSQLHIGLRENVGLSFVSSLIIYCVVGYAIALQVNNISCC